MTYAGVVDVSVYVKRNFAPIESRVQSITAILKQTPNIISAAKANLIESLPQPQIETAIEQANGTADFLKKDLLEALKDVKDSPMMTELRSTNEMAIKELRGYATWLKETKLPRATQNFALGTEKYRKLLQYGEMLNLSPEQILEIGMRELKRKQSVFEETARIIDPTKKAIEVFKEIQKDHPTEKGLIPDTARNMEMIRKFVVDHHTHHHSFTCPRDGH